MKKQVLSIVCALSALLLLSACGQKVVYVEKDSGGPTLSYAEEGVTEVDESGVSLAVQSALEKATEQSMSLSFRNEAVSSDGINFDCYLGNGASNAEDMYIQIFGDEALTDELYLSGLIRPGQAFDHITLNHALNPGTHSVYAAFTQVRPNDSGEFEIFNQQMLELEFVVSGG